MLLAIALSEYYGQTHVHYIPPKTEYTKMLQSMKSLGFITPSFNDVFYKLTEKGWNYLRRQSIDQFTQMDTIIDKFVEELE